MKRSQGGVGEQIFQSDNTCSEGVLYRWLFQWVIEVGNLWCLVHTRPVRKLCDLSTLIERLTDRCEQAVACGRQRLGLVHCTAQLLSNHGYQLCFDRYSPTKLLSPTTERLYISPSIPNYFITHLKVTLNFEQTGNCAVKLHLLALE